MKTLKFRVIIYTRGSKFPVAYKEFESLKKAKAYQKNMYYGRFGYSYYTKISLIRSE
jgi:hypothetical protein